MYVEWNGALYSIFKFNSGMIPRKLSIQQLTHIRKVKDVMKLYANYVSRLKYTVILYQILNVYYLNKVEKYILQSFNNIWYQGWMKQNIGKIESNMNFI